MMTMTIHALQKIAERASARKLVEHLMRRHSVRPEFRQHVASILRPRDGEAAMEAAIDQLYRNQRGWFF
jgi:hypothetical protein